MLNPLFDSIFKIFNQGFGDVFCLGLSKEEIDQQINEINISLPEEIYKLYEWKNGIKYRYLLFPGYEFPSLQDVIGTYRMLREVDNNENEYWKSSWFPIFISEVYIFTDCNSPATSMYFYDPSSGCAPEIIFLSLTSMMTSIIECYEESIYIIENLGGRYVIDIADETAETEIMTKYNPNVNYWTFKREMLAQELSED
jgi:hypothetical protein